MVVNAEDLLERAKARRLRVDCLGPPFERLDVGHRMQRRVPRDPVVVGFQNGARLGVDVRILKVGLWEGLGDCAVELRVGLDVHGRAAVVALQVQHVDPGQLAQLGDQLRRPVVLGVELESKLGVLG